MAANDSQHRKPEAFGKSLHCSSPESEVSLLETLSHSDSDETLLTSHMRRAQGSASAGKFKSRGDVPAASFGPKRPAESRGG